MTVELSKDDQALLEEWVASGIFPSVSDALHSCVQALAKLPDDPEWHAYATESIQAGLADIEAGRVVDGDSVMQRLRERAHRAA